MERISAAFLYATLYTVVSVGFLWLLMSLTNTDVPSIAYLWASIFAFFGSLGGYMSGSRQRN